MVVKYGYAVVEADTESEAIELTNNMDNGDFDWPDFDDALYEFSIKDINETIKEN